MEETLPQCSPEAEGGGTPSAGGAVGLLPADGGRGSSDHRPPSLGDGVHQSESGHRAAGRTQWTGGDSGPVPAAGPEAAAGPHQTRRVTALTGPRGPAGGPGGPPGVPVSRGLGRLLRRSGGGGGLGGADRHQPAGGAGSSQEGVQEVGSRLLLLQGDAVRLPPALLGVPYRGAGFPRRGPPAAGGHLPDGRRLSAGPIREAPSLPSQQEPVGPAERVGHRERRGRCVHGGGLGLTERRGKLRPRL